MDNGINMNGEDYDGLDDALDALKNKIREHIISSRSNNPVIDQITKLKSEIFNATGGFIMAGDTNRAFLMKDVWESCRSGLKAFKDDLLDGKQISKILNDAQIKLHQHLMIAMINDNQDINGDVREIIDAINDENRVDEFFDKGYDMKALASANRDKSEDITDIDDLLNSMGIDSPKDED